MPVNLSLLISRAPDIHTGVSALAPAAATTVSIKPTAPGKWYIRAMLTGVTAAGAQDVNTANFVSTMAIDGNGRVIQGWPLATEIGYFTQVAAADIPAQSWQLSNAAAGAVGSSYGYSIDAWFMGS